MSNANEVTVLDSSNPIPPSDSTPPPVPTVNNVETLPPPPSDVFNFTQSIRANIAKQILSGDVTQQDPKLTGIGVKVLRDMDSAEIGVKRLALDDKIAGNNADVARELIVAAYNNKANGVTPHTVAPPANAPSEPTFKAPDDLLPGFTPNEDIKGVGVADRTYAEVVASAPPKPTST